MGDIRWGILGAAKFARQHMGPAIAAAPGGHLAAVASRDPQKVAPFRTFAHGVRALDSYEAMVNAEYAANSSAISLELAHSKILINNKFN